MDGKLLRRVSRCESLVDFDTKLPPWQGRIPQFRKVGGFDLVRSLLVSLPIRTFGTVRVVWPKADTGHGVCRPTRPEGLSVTLEVVALVLSPVLYETVARKAGNLLPFSLLMQERDGPLTG